MRFASCPPNKIAAGATVAVFCFDNAKRGIGAYFYGPSVDQALAEARNEGFHGKLAQSSVIRPRNGSIARFIFIGLGLETEAAVDTVRRGAAQAARIANGLNAKNLYFKAPSLGTATETAQAIAEGVRLGLYRFTEFQSATPTPLKLETVFGVAKDNEEGKSIEAGFKTGDNIGSSVCFARDLINRPPSDATPDVLVRAARGLVGSGVSLKVFNKTQIKKMGMGAFLGVNRGSAQPPYFLHLTYKSAGKAKRKIGICGKGITFDSGGLSLKPPASMETMKYDMSGAASVFAVFRALRALKPGGVEVHGFTPLTENMPGSRAVKPGDVLKSMRGKTIEVLNTDAEGRLILADALSYASRQGLHEVFDIATLTGACVIALGNQIAAVMGNNDKLTARVKAAAAKAGEKIWELPLDKDYLPQLKSTVADLKNIGTPGQAGTIIAGLFLKEFVDAGLPWVHLDIASVGWASSQTPLSEIGSTGAMIRTLIQHILSYN